MTPELGPPKAAITSEEIRHEHLGRAPVHRVVVGKLLGHVALLDSRAVDEVDASEDHRSQPQPVQRHRGADPGRQKARVDWVANQLVGAAGHELWVGLLRHRGAPVPPEMNASPDREPQPYSEEDEAEASAPRICIEAVAAKGSQANQE